MVVKIDWTALGEVVLVSFGAAVGVVVIFALGVSALADPASAPGVATQGVTLRTAATRPVAMLCFLACALVVVYSLYLIIVR